MEARGGIEPPIKALQALALPLGDRSLVAGTRYRRFQLQKHKTHQPIPLAVGVYDDSVDMTKRLACLRQKAHEYRSYNEYTRARSLGGNEASVYRTQKRAQAQLQKSAIKD